MLRRGETACHTSGEGLEYSVYRDMMYYVEYIYIIY